MIKSSLVRSRLFLSWLRLHPFSWQSFLVFFIGYSITFVPVFFFAYNYAIHWLDSQDGVCRKEYTRVADHGKVYLNYPCGSNAQK